MNVEDDMILLTFNHALPGNWRDAVSIIRALRLLVITLVFQWCFGCYLLKILMKTSSVIKSAFVANLF